MLNEMKKSTPKIIQNVLKNEYNSLLEMYHHSVLSPYTKIFQTSIAILGFSKF